MDREEVRGCFIAARERGLLDLDELAQAEPPSTLFHGTGRSSIGSIMESGIERMGRHHVHLSLDMATALRVGRRHGHAVVFEVDSGRMQEEGFAFFVTDNRVWLTPHVPTRYLTPRWDAG
jgi:putative RNA 2'-phosphotransferase